MTGEEQSPFLVLAFHKEMGQSVPGGSEYNNKADY